MKHIILLLCIFGILCSTILYCEVFGDYLTLVSCSWPNVHEDRDYLHAIILADTHLLGPIRGHWLDKIYREYHMYKTFQAAVSLFKPEVIFILGDLFDEGDIVNTIEFNKYVERFRQIFHVPKNIQLLSTVGNHDIGFHYKMHPFLIRRFKKYFNNTSVNLYVIKNIQFILINSMAMKNDGCYFCENAVNDLIKISAKLNNFQDFNCSKKDFENKLNCYKRPIILQHFPTYRTSDGDCIESDSIVLEKFRVNWEVLSENSTKLLGELLNPRCIFSGHSHHYCFNINTLGIEEYTVASFNWRNKLNPSFLLGVFNTSDHMVSKCNMLNQQSVYNIYICAIMISSTLIFLRLLGAAIRNSYFLPRKKLNKCN